MRKTIYIIQKYERKCHVVFIQKYFQKSLFKELRRYLGEVFHDLAYQKQSSIEEGLLLLDHVHMLAVIPPNACSECGDRSYERQECDPYYTEL